MSLAADDWGETTEQHVFAGIPRPYCVGSESGVRLVPVGVDAYTRVHDSVMDALRQVEAAIRLSQENPQLLRPALDHYYEASKAYTAVVEQQAADTSEGD